MNELKALLYGEHGVLHRSFQHVDWIRELTAEIHGILTKHLEL